MCICSSHIRPKWRSQRWSIASRACPRVVSGNSSQTSLPGITRTSCGLQVTLLPPVQGHPCPLFGSTSKINGKPCECFALNLLYPRPDRRGFTRRPINSDAHTAGIIVCPWHEVNAGHGYHAYNLKGPTACSILYGNIPSAPSGTGCEARALWVRASAFSEPLCAPTFTMALRVGLPTNG